MTISSTTSSVSYLGNGSTTDFPITFPFKGSGINSEIRVIEVVVATSVETEKTNGTDYTVTGGDGSNGTVTATTPPASTVKWVIIRDTTQTQEVDYVENDPFPAEVHEAALDRLTMIAQEHETNLGRTAQLPEGYTGLFDPTLPDITANRFLSISSDGLNFELSDVGALGNVVISDDVPQNLGTASSGTSSEVSRSDHVHNLPDAADLNLEIGTDVQAYSDLLADISGLTVSSGDILYVNGTSNIVNLSKGTDGQVLSLASGLPSWQDAASGGKLIQEVTFQDGEVATGTTTATLDDTPPQNTEGTEFMSLSITPTSATNKLIIEVVANYSSGAAAQMIMGLFQDSTVNAIAATQDIADGAGNAQQMQLTHTMTAGTTSATTFKVNIGANTAGTVTFNGRSSGRIFGGVMASTITIREVEV